MIIRQLNEHEFKEFYNQLICKAHQNPVDAEFHVPITVDKNEYILRIQPTTKYRIAILQVLLITREKGEGILHTLITDNKILLALFEILRFQGMA